jgi:hypothetical protein
LFLLLGKYESIGSLAVSSLLIVGAIGIGHHSYELLVDLFPSEIPANINELNGVINSANPHPLNPNAAWFAAASVLVKEALFRISMFNFTDKFTFLYIKINFSIIIKIIFNSIKNRIGRTIGCFNSQCMVNTKFL